VGPRAGEDDVEKRKFLTVPRLEFRPHGRPAHSQSICRLSSPGSPSWQYYEYYKESRLVNAFKSLITIAIDRTVAFIIISLNLYVVWS
jgi:hypothetical protein